MLLTRLKTPEQRLPMRKTPNDFYVWTKDSSLPHFKQDDIGCIVISQLIASE